MESHCIDHPVLVENVKEIKEVTNEIKVGLYGSPTNPNSGFVHTINEEVKSVRRDVAGVKTVLDAVKSSMVKAFWTVLGTLLVAGTSAAVAMFRTEWFK